jgi:hypothetical protein
MPSHQIESSNPPPEFFEARNVAGATLEKHFNLLPKSGSPSRDVKWLKALAAEKLQELEVHLNQALQRP